MSADRRADAQLRDLPRQIDTGSTDATLAWPGRIRAGIQSAPDDKGRAGPQPRQRGTQKIRRDDYSFDDPHLLENALRLPRAF